MSAEASFENYAYHGVLLAMTRAAACSFSVTFRISYKFTGKERDSESGLDNFGARYYGLTMGRFVTPDWSEEPKPYADLRDPNPSIFIAMCETTP